MNACPSVSPSFCPTRRDRMSTPPPGAVGTMMRTGFEGYAAVCAHSDDAAAVVKARTIAAAARRGV